MHAVLVADGLLLLPLKLLQAGPAAAFPPRLS
jgi:hypothetical protein